MSQNIVFGQGTHVSVDSLTRKESKPVGLTDLTF